MCHKPHAKFDETGTRPEGLIACLGVQRLPIYPHGAHRSTWAIQLLTLMSVGGIVYFAACAAMGMKVMEHLPRRRKRL